MANRKAKKRSGSARRTPNSNIVLAPNGLPASSDWLFPEYDFEKMRPEKHYSPIIERILERGSWAEINWLFDHYGEKRIKQWVREHGFRGLSRRSFALWKLVFDIRRYRRPWWAKIDNAWPY